MWFYKYFKASRVVRRRYVGLLICLDGGMVGFGTILATFQKMGYFFQSSGHPESKPVSTWGSIVVGHPFRSVLPCYEALFTVEKFTAKLAVGVLALATLDNVTQIKLILFVTLPKVDQSSTATIDLESIFAVVFAANYASVNEL
jgi:hypothetical protein